MKILVLHRIPFTKVQYDRCLDHGKHEVTYFGTAESLTTIPAELRCTRLVRPEASPEAWAALLSPSKFDRVVALSEYDLVPAARLRELLGVTGARVSDVQRVRDKMLMKRLVGHAGIRAPGFETVADFMKRGTSKWKPGPVVLKPVDGASSENVVVFQSARDLYQAVVSGTTGVSALNFDGFEVEEFVQGQILHIDGFVTDGFVRAVLPSLYLNTCLDYAQGMPLGSWQLADSPALAEFTRRCLSAVGIRSGAYHLEAILSSDGPVFLEIANRCGGAEVVSTYQMATGVNLYHAHLRSVLGLDVGPVCETKRSEFFGWFVVPGHHLAMQDDGLRYPAELRASASVVRWVEKDANRPLPRKITYQLGDVPLGGIVRGDSPRAVREFIERVFRNVEQGRRSA